MTKKCLMLKFPDDRKVFVPEKTHLSGFIDTFGVEVYAVEADSPPLLSPEELAKIFCDLGKTPDCDYKIVKGKVETGARQKMLQKAFDIHRRVEEKFLAGETVRIKQLYKEFGKHGVGVSTIYRHVAVVRAELESRGYRVEKISVGNYLIRNKPKV